MIDGNPTSLLAKNINMKKRRHENGKDVGHGRKGSVLTLMPTKQI